MKIKHISPIPFKSTLTYKSSIILFDFISAPLRHVSDGHCTGFICIISFCKSYGSQSMVILMYYNDFLFKSE